MNNNEYNFIVKNQFLVGDEQQLFFCGEPVTFLEPTVDMFDILVQTGIFASKSQARKSGRDKEIPEGFTDMIIGKLRKRICIFNPTEKNLLNEDEN